MGRIIVTGGLGFIGSHFVNLLYTKTEHEIVILDKITYAAKKENVRVPHMLIEKDICDVTENDLGEFDYIINFAAESHVDNSIKNGLPFVKTNVEGTYNLIEISRKNSKLKKFVQISTDEVYGDMDEYLSDVSSDENFIINPSSYYSATKTSSDLLVISANRTYGLPYIITRTCNNYGENQHNEKFIPTIINSIREDKDIPVYGDGEQVREWIHADDNAESIIKILFSDKVNQIYNIGTNETYTNNQLIGMVGDILSKKVKFKYVQDRLGHDRRYTLNSNKFKSEFGEIQKTNLKNWLDKTISSKPTND
jgi:dTDP-glucose 4,6-dehydratase